MQKERCAFKTTMRAWSWTISVWAKEKKLKAEKRKKINSLAKVREWARCRRNSVDMRERSDGLATAGPGLGE